MTNLPQEIIPLLAQIGFTFVVTAWMVISQMNAMFKGDVSLSETKFRGAKYPAKGQQAGDAFLNQFELPVLFYAIILTVVALEIYAQTITILAWIFVISRIIHASIHLSYNNVKHRFATWLIGLIALLLIYISVIAAVLL